MSVRRWLVSLVLLSLIVTACGEATRSASPDASAATSSAPSPLASTAAGPPCPTTPDASGPASRGWWQDRVFYETFVRSFADSNGDGIGDLQGLISKLDYLNDGDPATTDDLGVTALWLMPIDASPSYHGYDVTDYRKVEPDYGTNDDFKALVSAARQRGIEIVVDFVPNHTSVESPWFQASRTPGSTYDDWYLWSTTDPGVVSPDGRQVWYKDGERYYYGYFWEGMPDLNLTNPDVTAELDSIAKFWVEDMGAAGFRLDAARHLIEDDSDLIDTPETHQWLQGFKRRLDAVDPDALLLGEVWDTTDVASSYVDDGSLDLTFDFDLAEKMAGAVYQGSSSLLRIAQNAVTGAYPAGGYATFLTNHDQDRIFDVLAHSTPRAKQAATLLLTNGGVPFLYYGEEIGLTGRKPDERIRTPMPWTGDGPGYGFTTGTPWEAMAEDVETTTNVAAQQADPDSLLAWYRSLIALRAAHPALRPGGTLTPLDTSSRKVYANLRYDPATGEVVVVASNLSGDPIKDVTLSLDRGPLCGAPTAMVALATAGPTDLAAPSITADGGFDGWAIGDLPANGDVVIALAR
jgi:glycosidase